MNSNRNFLRNLDEQATPEKLFTNQGIVMNRLDRTEKPRNKILPGRSNNANLSGEQDQQPPNRFD